MEKEELENNEDENIKYNPITIKINTNKKDGYLHLLKNIDFNFCIKFNTGPYFLSSTPDLFNNDLLYKSTKILKELYKITDYSKYLNQDNPNFIDYEKFYNSSEIYNLKYISNINESILYCPSMSFRIPLYLIKLSENPKEIFYSNEHISINDKEKIQEIKNQIKLDINRTIIQYPIGKEKEFTIKLSQLLFEISCRENNLSYIQGMNFIAAFILLLTGNNSELSLIIFFKIFYMESNYFHKSFKFCYDENFSLLIHYVVLFKDLLLRYNKDLYNHIINLDENFFWLMKWIQTLFVINFNFEFAIKCWDIIIAKGLDSIISISLSIIMFLEKQIFQCEEIEHFMNLINNLNYINVEDSVDLFNFIFQNIENNTWNFE